MKSLILLLAIFSVSTATVVTLKQCETNNETCTVSEVRVEPSCRNPKKCRLKKGREASVSIDMTPNFAASELITKVFYESIKDTEWAGMEPDGCKSITCPLVAGQKVQSNHTFKIFKMYPSGTFPIRWIIENKANPDEACCFRMVLELY